MCEEASVGGGESGTARAPVAWILLLLAGLSLAGCGRFGFTPPGDGAEDAAVWPPDAPGTEAGLPDAPVGSDRSLPDAPLPPQITTLAGTGQAGFVNGPAASAQFSGPHSVVVTASGAILVADPGNHVLRKIEGGQVTTFAGTGQAGFLDGPAASATFLNPVGMAIDAAGRVYVADGNNHAIRMIEGGQVTTLAGTGQAGFLDGPAASATFHGPHDVTVGGGGVIYVADASNRRIRKIDQGTVSTLAGSGVKGYVDGPVASAQFVYPLAVHAAGSTVYVGEYDSGRIRVIAGGTVSTLVGGAGAGYQDGPISSARLSDPHDIFSLGTGPIYVADQYNLAIRKIEGGVVSTVASNGSGGATPPTPFNHPVGLVLADSHTIYVADGAGHRLFEVTF